jgi:hypothetical protein
MHATDTGEGHPDSAADEQEAPMFEHPNTIVTSGDLHRQDLLATAARERQAATVLAPALPWRMVAVRVVAIVALCLGMRG